MDYTTTKAIHNLNFCEAIATAFGQTPGGWSIGHSVARMPVGTPPELVPVVLTLPDGIATEAQLDALAAALPPVIEPLPAVFYSVAEITALVDASAGVNDLKDVLRLMARGLDRRIPKP